MALVQVVLRLIFGPAYIAVWFVLLLCMGVVAVFTFILLIISTFMTLAD
jgi:hypothetical protein